MNALTNNSDHLTIEGIETFLEQAMRQTELPPTEKKIEINTCVVIRSIAKALPDNLSTTERQQLEKLCRKVEIAKVVYDGYEREWKKKLGRELRVGYWARRFYERLSDRQIEKIFNIMQSSGILEDLLKAEDLSFDSHGGVVSRVFNYKVFLRTIAAMNIPASL